MGQFLRNCLQAERKAFLDDLRPKYILASLISDGIITPDERQDILSEKTPRNQVQRLFKILPKKGERAFDCFVAALQKDNAYPWLADSLLDRKKNNNFSTVNGNDELYEQLVLGGVPFQTNYLFRRDSFLTQIRNELRKSVVRRHWVVVHGMLGCGKSVLAAESLRDPELFSDCFPNGVCWIAIGKLRTNVTLQHKLQILWKKLEPSKSHLTANSEILSSTSNDGVRPITKHLSAVFSRKEDRNFLLILDDVWDSSVIEAFDIGCPIMVTTRDISIFDSVSGFCSFVKITDGLTFKETVEFLGPCVKVHPSELPQAEISKIHSKCKGSPLLLSLIPPIMSLHGNKIERWKSLSEKLDKGIAEVLQRSRNRSGDSADIRHMIELSIEALDMSLKDYFFDFAIFEEDVFVKNRVLEILWDKDKMDVEFIMQDLYQKSLVLFEEDREIDSYMYSVHDLYLEFLKDECSKKLSSELEMTDLEKRHEKLVDQYLSLCKTNDGSYDYSLLPDDGYIHYYIGYHLDKANCRDFFTEIYLDLGFIQNKLRFAGASDLLYDFNTYKLHFIERLEDMHDIDSFIRKNAHLIAQKDSDIIQLALFEPSESSVYRNARRKASEKSGKLYFEWSNQANVPYLSILNVNLGIDNIHCARFSPNSSIVASVGEDTSIMMWDSSSGKELEKLTGHTSAINCCVFNSSGSLLATASNDKTVKLWEINYMFLSTKRSSKTKKLSIPIVPIDDFNKNGDHNMTFSCHEAEVLWCAFSSNDQLIVSSDNTGVAYVWDVDSKEVKWRILNSFEPDINSNAITSCHFSHNSNRIALTCASNIVIWNTYSQRQEAILSHENCHVSNFCFSKNDMYLFSASGSSIWRWDMADFISREICSSIRSVNLCCCTLSPDERFIASGTSDFSVIVWNTTSMKPVANLKGHKSYVQSVAYCDDGSKLLSASSDGHIIIWNMKECSATSMVSLESNLSVQYDEVLMVASSDNLNRIQVRTDVCGRLKHKSLPDVSDITACFLSDNCSEVVYGTKSGTVKVFVLDIEKTVQYNPAHSARITYLTHIKGSLEFVSCSEDCTLRLWNKEGNYTAFKGHKASVVMCVLFSGNKKLLSCSDDGTLRVWDINSSKTIMVLEGHGNQKVTCCDVSPCEKLLCSASTDRTIKIWDANNGEELKTLSCFDCVRCCRFSPRSRVLVSGEDSGRVMMWNISPKMFNSKSLGMHDTWVKDIKFSSDGSQFASVSDSIKLWDKDGHLAQTIILPGAFACALWASPDFKMFVLIHNSVLYILKSIL